MRKNYEAKNEQNSADLTQSSNQSHSSNDEKTLDYTPPTQPKTNRRKRRAQPRGAVARGRVQRRRQEEIEVVTTLQRKKERLRALITELQEQQVRTILLATVEKSPDVLWDILDCGQFDGQQQQPDEPQLSTMLPESPSPGPSSSQGPSWCVCGNCVEMPTAEERVCCGKAPDYCLSTLPHFQLIALDENVLQVANLYRQDIFAYPEDVDRNKGYRHAAYRQFILWQHGRLGAGNRKVIPSCCVTSIRRKFPDPHGHYVGFIPGRLG